MSTASSNNDKVLSEQQHYHRRQKYLTAMGVDVWVARGVDPGVQAEPPATHEPAGETLIEPESDQSSLADNIGWDDLQSTVSACQACDLYKTRTQTVFGVGNRQADWLFIGEAPGADEDRQGEPFVGRAGQLLNSMLYALGLAREQVFIANVLKCRPPNNRDPKTEEVKHCESFLQQQIRLIQPRIIVALGRHAAQSLLDTGQALAKLRGTVHQYENTPLVVTYHPAYLLRSPSEKGKAWADLCLAREQVQEP